ncbi:MAG: phage tail protein [Chloroflexi bacterium]|nr:phage tail protein [Chloroflexota bacterium]
MVRQKPYRRVLIGAIFAFVFVAALACEDLPADLAALATAQPQEVATLQAALTSTVKEAVPTATAQPEPTATPIQRRLTGAAQFTPTPAPDSVEPLVDGPDDTGLVQANSAFSSTQSRDSSGGRFALTINGSAPDPLHSVENGIIQGEVVTQQLGSDNLTRKHLATISYQPFNIEVDMDMSGQFYEWIEDAIDGNSQEADGEVIVLGADFGDLSTRQFTDAIVTKVTFPALDGSSRDAAHLGVQFTPEQINYDSGNDGLAEVSAGRAKQMKGWLVSNFRIELGDLPTDRVSKIDSFSWEQKVVESQVGSFGNQTLQPAGVEVSNLKLTISMADIDEWADWFDEFVVDGHASDSDELSGTLTFLAPDLQAELATVLLDHVGIISLSLPSLEANQDQVQRFTVELYVEDLFFEYIGDGGSGSVIPSVPTPTPAAQPTAASTSTPAPVAAPPSPTATANAQTPTPTSSLLPPAFPTAISNQPPLVTGNESPTVAILSSVEDVEGSPVVLDYRLSDSTGDSVSVEVAYSLDSGRSFRNASPTSRLAITRNLATSASGKDYSFTWNSGLDLGDKSFDGVLVRITPSDASVGRSAQTRPFAYNPLRNAVASACGVRDGQWLLDSRNWDVLHKALLVCQNDLVLSIQEGLTSIDSTARSTRTLSTTLNDISSAQKLASVYGTDAVSLQSVAGLADGGTVSTDKLGVTLATLDGLAAELDKTLATMGDDSQLMNLDLQGKIQQQQQTLQTLSNVSKMMHDTAMSIIRNIRA